MSKPHIRRVASCGVHQVWECGEHGLGMTPIDAFLDWGTRAKIGTFEWEKALPSRPVKASDLFTFFHIPGFGGRL